uniref:SSD domain-containing protein n=1 Tax=Globodera pallida TaxID=36090 RepID=A0A183C8A6_GLOPA
MPNFNCLERPLSQLFYRYGRFITRCSFPLIVIPLLITIFSVWGFLSLTSITDAIYLFTPMNAPSKMERQVIHDLWPLVNGSYIPGRAVTQSREVQITVSAREPGANILEKPYSEAVHVLDEIIQQDVRVEHEGHTYRYRDLCLQWRTQGCPGNKHVHMLSDLYQHGFNITYPMLKLGTVHAYIGATLGGVTVGYGANDSMVLRGAHSWLMVYHLQFYPPNVSFLSGLWEKEFERKIRTHKSPFITFTYFHSQTLAEELKRNADTLVPRFVSAFCILILFSVLCNMSTCRQRNCYIDWTLSKPVLAILGVANAGMGILTAIGVLNMCSMPYNDIVGVMPFLVVAVGVDNMFLMIAAVRRTNRASPASRRMGEAMADAAISMLITALTDALSFGVGAITSIPAVLCNMSTCRQRNCYIDWTLSKPVLAILGVANAGMGILTAIGVLNMCSMPYNDIVGVMPFLVVAVGVDNMFLMIAAVRRTNRASPASRRMGEAMADAAISMLITALTDALSFGVGAITSIPAVQIFCIYTCAAITITFVYQITFFAALLALAIKWEADGLHCVLLRPTVPEEEADQHSLFTRLFMLGSRAHPDPTKLEINLRDSQAAKFFQNWFAPILMQPIIRALALLWFVVYVVFAVYGCSQLREGLEPVNLLVKDSYAIPHYRALENYFWHYGATVQIVVNNPPNLGDLEERQRTVFLAITLGLLHGLVFLPVTLALCVRGVFSAGGGGGNATTAIDDDASRHHCRDGADGGGWMCALLRRVRRQCARRWHSFLPLAWLFNNAAGDDDDLSKQICLRNAAQTSVGTTPPRHFLNANNICAFLCALSALLALPLFLFLLFITGLSDHFFETPIDQFRWSDVDVREQVIRDLLGPHLSNTNLRTDQSSALINPWPHLFPHPLIEPNCRQNLLNQKRSVLIIVKSAPDRLERRDAVRATYGALKRYPPASADGRAEDAGASFRLRTIFVLGRPPNTAAPASAAAQMDALEREAAAHGDLLVGDFADTYFNNTLKFVHSVRFARHHCAPLGNPVPYTLLLDDDYLLFPWNLIAELQSADGRAEDAGASFRLRTIFVLGRPPNTAAPASAAAQMDALEREAAAHGDLLVGDFADTYFNNTLKFVHSVRFARHHCAPLGNPVPYALLLDDDYLLFPWNLVAELQR